MAATFGSPVSAVLLAIELLLFEFRPRSIIPVSLASATATAVRIVFVGTAPIFAMPDRRAAERRSAGDVRRSSARWSASLSVYVTRARLLRSRTCSRNCPSTGCGGRRSAAVAVGRRWLLRAADARRRLRQHRSNRRRQSGRRGGGLSVRVEVHLLGRSRSAAGRPAERWRRCSRSAAGAASCSASCCRLQFPHFGIDPRICGAGRHGGHVRRRLAGAAGVGRIRLRDHAAAAGPLAAARLAALRDSWSRRC